MCCICGNEKTFDECCGSIINNQKKATTAEELMRSRYSAYVQGNGKYLVLSTKKENQYQDDIELIEEFSSHVDWLKLDVLHVEPNIVEFKAYYKESNTIKVLHEKSNFICENGTWFYVDGELYNSKVERNEVCPCGSGKKFKKCCA